MKNNTEKSFGKFMLLWSGDFVSAIGSGLTEYYVAAEPPVRCGVSHLSGLTEPLI